MSDEKPEWLRVRPPSGSAYERMRDEMSVRGVRTVCSSSQCPNKGECWSQGHAAFMILGTICTRRCGFCAVSTGVPDAPDPQEPAALGETVRELDLDHCIITSVARDDLEDAGARHFAATVEAIRERSPASIELLIPDMGARREPLEKVISSSPDIIGHNVEVVRRLQGVRDPRASYDVSLAALALIKEIAPGTTTKSSLMLGMGETADEVLKAMSDLRAVDVDMLSLGQYLRPRGGQIPVSRYVTPSEFKELEEKAYDIGFRKVASGPLVRSSYRPRVGEPLC